MPEQDSRSEPTGARARPPELLNLIRRSWLLIAASVVLCVAAAVFFTMGQTKIYEAQTTVQIDPNPPKPLGRAVQNIADVGNGSFWNTREYYKTQYEIIRSRRMATLTVRRLGLHRDGTFILNLPSDAALPDGFEPTETAAQSALRSRIQVAPINDSRLMVVKFKDAEPERGKRVLSTLVEVYLDQNVDGVLASTTTASEWLGVQMGKLKDELTDRELALHEFKKDNRILSVSMDDQNNMLRDEMRQLNHELTRVRTGIEELRSRVEQLEELDAHDPIHLPAQELLDSSLLQRLRSDYVAAKKDQVGLIQGGKGVNHPLSLAAASRVELSKTALLAEVSNVREALQRQLNAKRAEAGGLSGLYQRAKSQALELNRLGLEYQRLERAKENTEKVFSLVLERSKESDLTRHMRFNNIRVIDAAMVGTAPVEPRRIVNLAVGGFLGLCLGLLIALGRTLLDRTFRTAREVEELLGLTLLGALPKASKGPREPRGRRKRRSPGANPDDLIVHTKPNSTAAEAARALRTNLMFIDPDKQKRAILVTSGGPSDGKTTVACWIACALAQANQRVLLLDCDLRRPRLHKAFGRTNEAGVSTALFEPSAMDGWDLTTDVPNLDLLTTGPGVPNPAELLQSDRFEKLMDRLSEKYDTLVIDSPPVAAVTDATVLSTKVDGTILVIRAHSTPRDLASQGVRTLRDVGSKMLGFVLNDLDPNRNGYGYGEYYKYQYSYQDSDRD